MKKTYSVKNTEDLRFLNPIKVRNIVGQLVAIDGDDRGTYTNPWITIAIGKDKKFEISGKLFDFKKKRLKINR